MLMLSVFKSSAIKFELTNSLTAKIIIMERLRMRKKLYESLGIKVFRNLILKFEHIKHRKDGLKNINYHLKENSIASLQSFKGYLLYNAVWHIGSLAFVAVYFATTWIMGVRYIFLDVLMYILTIINLYCIMLQRYIFIKIQTYVGKRINIMKKQAAEKMEFLTRTIADRDYHELYEEFSLIKKIQECVQNGTDCFVGESDVPVLCSIARNACATLRVRCGNNGDIHRKTLAHFISRIPKRPLVVNRIEKITAKMQNLLRLKKCRNVLFGFSIITENSECECAYRQLVPHNSRDRVEFVTDVLFNAYDKALSPINKGMDIS